MSMASMISTGKAGLRSAEDRKTPPEPVQEKSDSFSNHNLLSKAAEIAKSDDEENDWDDDNDENDWDLDHDDSRNSIVVPLSGAMKLELPPPTKNSSEAVKTEPVSPAADTPSTESGVASDAKPANVPSNSLKGMFRSMDSPHSSPVARKAASPAKSPSENS